MQAPREIELKLTCDEPALARLARHPLLQAGAETEPLALRATYYDTAARDLERAGLSLRVRREDARTVQTVKGAAASVGLFDRPEWEGPIEGPGPDLAALADTPAAAILAEAAAPDLAPLYATVVERTVRPVRYGASRIAVTLDAGRIETAAGTAPVCEVEFELAEGDPADLFALAQALAETIPLRLGALSKSERGEAVLAGTLHRPSKAERIVLDEASTAGEALVRIVEGCLRHLSLNEAVFLQTSDPEALHQVRVALRRLRSALTLYKPMLATDAAAQRLRTDIKRVTEPFGTARNLDVYLEETLAAEIERRPDEPALDALRARTLAERDRAYDAVIGVLEGAAWRGLLIDLLTWVEAGSWRDAAGPERDPAPRDRPAAAFAAAVLKRLRRRVKRRGRGLARLDPEARHRVRIEAKKLRYGAEFFGGLFPDRRARKRHKAFVAALADLQDHLGALNDLATAHGLAATLSATVAAPPGSDEPATPAPALFAAGLTAADAEARAGDRLAKAEAAHGTLVDLRPFWR